MKKIELFYGTDLKWIKHYADSFEGIIKDNFIVTSNNIVSGTIYFLDCGNGINALYLDVEYNIDICISQNNVNDNFVGLYYNLTEGEAKLSVDNSSKLVGHWHYNLAIIDSTLQTEYIINKGSKTIALFVFIDKEMIKHFMSKEKKLNYNINKLIDPKKNTFIKFDRISDNSLHILINLQKTNTDDGIFKLNLLSTINILLSNYLQKIKNEKVIIQTVYPDDLSSILKAQKFLVDHIEQPFPSIEKMSQDANMSESKFKNLFKKITGTTPNNFYLTNKLMKAKNMLEEGQLSILEVSNELNFANNSYFTLKFKEKFGINPKKFTQKK